jgi:Family of unknown function (DUF5686)/CarboxypepD_reg-like domain
MMKRSALLLVIFLLPIISSFAQTIKGKVTNESGEPIQYATVYIQELKQGTTANTRGDYEIKLPAGKYLVTYQSLGYSPVFYDITISNQTITKNVTLPLQYYEIPEVRITATGEDPAYGIMRKAIGMAPYYLNNISYYKADVYLKGNLIFNKIPKIMKKAMKMEASHDDGSTTSTIIKEGDVFIMESFNEIEFTEPEKYVQKVISINSTFPDEGDNISPMDYINASFYQPLIANLAISPLSPQAFSHYKFKYLGATPQGNNIIDKIQVIPKIKSQQLFEGTIYIIEDLWCLQCVDLTNENIAGRIHVQQLFIPVEDDIWMPVSHKFDIDLEIVGIRAKAGYGSSVKYTEVRPNTSLRKPDLIAATGFSKPAPSEDVQNLPVSKNQEKIDEILKKDELSNRDMVKLTRLMEKESENALPDSLKNSLEIKDNTISSVEKDASKKDSTYWTEIRPIPLSDLEMKSIRIRDSIRLQSSLQKAKADTLPSGEKKEKSKFLTTLKNIGLGHTWSDTTGFRFNFGGILDPENLSFNTVDGFIYGMNFRISKNWKNKKSFSLSPEFWYAFSRESFMWRLNGNYTFDRPRQRQFYFRAGMTSRDIGTGGSINTLINSVSSLFFERNYLKLFENDYVAIGYRNRISTGINLDLTAEYDRRKLLDNTTSFSFIKSSHGYSDNIPDNYYLSDEADSMYALRDQKHFEFVTNVTFTPRQRYRVVNGVKIPAGSDWPSFTLTWKHGINEFPEPAHSYKHFDMIRFEAYKHHDLGAFSELYWRVRAGGFLDKNNLTFYDFFHYNAQPLPVLIDNYQDAFRLKAYYSLSSPELFGEAHLKYTTPYLLLKYLPGISKTLMRENLSLSWIGSKFHHSYTEIGYSITELLLIGELGVYAGFENLKYKSTGVRLVLRLN